MNQNKEDLSTVHHFTGTDCSFTGWQFNVRTFIKIKEKNPYLSSDELLVLSTTGSLENEYFSIIETKRIIYHCKFCTYTCRSFSGIYQHIKKCHNIKISITCPYCSKDFYGAGWFEKHLFMHITKDAKDIQK